MCLVLLEFDGNFDVYFDVYFDENFYGNFDGNFDENFIGILMGIFMGTLMGIFIEILMEILMEILRGIFMKILGEFVMGWPYDSSDCILYKIILTNTQSCFYSDYLKRQKKYSIIRSDGPSDSSKSYI